EGWPLCTGRVVPSVGGATLVEFTHRVLAGLVAVLVVLLPGRLSATCATGPGWSGALPSRSCWC
ncbi:MAG TPA: hypothetical protein PKD47_05260, partial [Solirubrobacterales bacterium]|nr:hypothetical protein [Solirubrobacterales bacterium]